MGRQSWGGGENIQEQGSVRHAFSSWAWGVEDAVEWHIFINPDPCSYPEVHAMLHGRRDTAHFRHTCDQCEEPSPDEEVGQPAHEITSERLTQTSGSHRR